MVGNGDLPFASLKCLSSGNICYQAQLSNLTSKSSFTPEEKTLPGEAGYRVFCSSILGCEGGARRRGTRAGDRDSADQ